MSAPVKAGVRLQMLRAGSSAETLFLVPGLEGDPAELADLAAAMTGPQAVYVVAPTAESEPRLETMAAGMVAALRGVQPAGPYRLGGYSFGGLAAFEMAQQLRAAGETVESLFLIDALFDERYWPRRTWLRALVRRTWWQLLRIVRLPPREAVGELRRRGVRLLQRLRRRNADTPDPLRVSDEPDAPDVRVNALTAIGGYRPQHYDGDVTLIASAEDHHFGCDTARLWDGYARRIDLQRIAGDHLTVMQRPAAAAVIGHLIDHRLAARRADWPGLRPVDGFARPMIVTTMRWFSAARLAHALAEAGFEVSACRPGDHPLEVVTTLSADHRLRRGRRLASLEAAIRATRPDILLPDDERAWALLRRLHARTTDPATRTVIEHSLGHGDDWAHISSRTAVAQEARKAGVAVPDTEVITGPAALAGWTYPLMLKTDGSWGGRGVAMVSDESRLAPTWATISRPPSYPRAVKRLVVNRETDGLVARLRGRRPVVNAQQHLEGRDAVVTVACLAGKVRDLICLEVVRASAERGPAEVVRVIDHPKMAAAASQVVERFGLTGFCGMDFLLTPDGDAYLVELNSRVTPTCHLLVEGAHEEGQVLTLFPADCAEVEMLDVPLRSLALAELGERLVARRSRPLTRMGRRLTQRLTSSDPVGGRPRTR
ncbi:thioesterase domain-containing protein [Paractinoplanes globisporus]|uniref:Thioesterase domain-containing protein n=1 Tax=Paractinoplanes globisporus TaxID=113565 RepID=A0ABW6WEN6_9ACTN|nr:thioesterase domain-containing protein [Actinoplanes globisporus]